MTDQEWEDFAVALVRRRWRLEQKSPEQPLTLSAEIQRRYPQLPEEYETFLNLFASAVSPDGKAWFLCEGEYNGNSDCVWPWNECERQSLEAGGKDAALAESIRAFWDEHLPIAFSVKGEYAYLALTVSPEDFGSVVYGHEPEYEDGEIICGSFGELTGLMVQFLRRGPGQQYQDIEDFV